MKKILKNIFIVLFVFISFQKVCYGEEIIKFKESSWQGICTTDMMTDERKCGIFIYDKYKKYMLQLSSTPNKDSYALTLTLKTKEIINDNFVELRINQNPNFTIDAVIMDYDTIIIFPIFNVSKSVFKDILNQMKGGCSLLIRYRGVYPDSLSTLRIPIMGFTQAYNWLEKQQ